MRKLALGIVLAGSFGVFAANRVTRTITLPIRIIGSSKDNLDTQLSNLNYALAKASRFIRSPESTFRCPDESRRRAAGIAASTSRAIPR